MSIASDKAHTSLGFLLSQVGAHAARRFALRLAAIDLHPPLFRALNVVDAAEGQSQQAIGEAIGAPASRMVAIIDELEERSLVERRPHPSDRRIRAVYLTPAGRRLLTRGRRIAMEHERDLRRGLSEADGRRLIALLQKVVDAQEIGSGVHPGLREADAGHRGKRP